MSIRLDGAAPITDQRGQPAFLAQIRRQGGRAKPVVVRTTSHRGKRSAGQLSTALLSAKQPALVYQKTGGDKTALVLIDRGQNDRKLGEVEIRIPRDGDRVELLRFTST